MAEASGESNEMLLKRRNATRSKATVLRFAEGDHNDRRRSGFASEIEIGDIVRTSCLFYTSGETISPSACLSSLESRQRPTSEVSIESSSSYMSIRCECYMEDSDMESSCHSSVGYVICRGENFMSDSENEQSSMFTSSMVSDSTVTDSSDSGGSSASISSTMISGYSSAESTFIFDPKNSNCLSQNKEELSCTKCGHVRKVTTNPLFKNVFNLPPRNITFPCDFKDLLQLQFRPSITDAYPTRCVDALANGSEITMRNDRMQLVDKTNVHEMSEIAGIVAADLATVLRLNHSVAEGLHIQTKERISGIGDDQRLCELKTYQDDLRQICADRTHPKELLRNTHEDGNKQPKDLLCVKSDNIYYSEDPPPETLLPGVPEDESVNITKTNLQSGATCRRLYSVYDNVQRCYICGKCDKNNYNCSNINSNSGSKTSVEYFCKKSNRYFCSLCEQEHKTRIPDCVIIAREQ
ncbi:uncharacterized protein LOC127838896 [Dreissena polymorpha]|uniref:Uncharacterized protein n=1 Tax=Dreissena polymorpha TaxID=45954 RepID=A0A9D4FJK2_DREPO|nr:uncharacterized protein LOC127838896 [Dreissena polymorpha]XP_052222921.1 uncharacterized protein LOC127838896 [Dreissena polymorpha]XP_052222922.1 uncharacterized protein LOC127838896 [Dreissena polymorpha]XP_052222923.1 uncharacterized protein LOC127838896 [Dreissena polymorpha]XP_052222924.1 uncharacterized protein LOC127838896 [Dreissena polymorpha]XP_052222925.1 uncharacterized protein LOC127838896 [Dreissena polymorpha]KAH3798854.1 hypothetical protein DPMN_152457 [Dreissena polymorp